MPTNQWSFDTDEDDEYDDGQGQQQQPQLPSEARKYLRKLAKENADLKKQLEESTAKARSASVADVVRAKGYDPKIAGLYPSSLTASEEDVVKWLEEHSGLFAKTTTEGTPATTATETEPTVPELPPEIMEALGLVTRAATSGVAPPRPGDLEARIKAAKSPEELQEVLREGGMRI